MWKRLKRVFMTGVLGGGMERRPVGAGCDAGRILTRGKCRNAVNGPRGPGGPGSALGEADGGRVRPAQRAGGRRARPARVRALRDRGLRGRRGGRHEDRGSRRARRPTARCGRGGGRRGPTRCAGRWRWAERTRPGTSPGRPVDRHRAPRAGRRRGRGERVVGGVQVAQLVGQGGGPDDDGIGGAAAGAVQLDGHGAGRWARTRRAADAAPASGDGVIGGGVAGGHGRRRRAARCAGAGRSRSPRRASPRPAGDPAPASCSRSSCTSAHQVGASVDGIGVRPLPWAYGVSCRARAERAALRGRDSPRCVVGPPLSNRSPGCGDSAVVNGGIVATSKVPARSQSYGKRQLRIVRDASDGTTPQRAAFRCCDALDLAKRPVRDCAR